MPRRNSFPLKLNELAAFARDAAMWIAWALALPAIVALVVEAAAAGPAAADAGTRGRLPAGHDPAVGRRAHQSHLQELLGPAAAGGGDASSTATWNSCRGGIRAASCGRNCSFFSGEGATAFWTYAPAALTPPAWRPLAYAAATLFGVVTSGLRMAFGGHFFTDVAAAGLVTFLVIWLAYALDLPLAVDPAARTTQIEAALTRLGLARIPPVAALARTRGGLIRSEPDSYHARCH